MSAGPLLFVTVMYVRFVSTFPDCHTGRPVGFFQAAGIVREDPETPGYIVDLLREHGDWFNANLARPSRFSKSRHPDAMAVALSWFLPTATECIERAREMAVLISECTFPISMITTSRPGIIVYRDAMQIAAIPYRR